MTSLTIAFITAMLLVVPVSAQELGYVDIPEMPGGIEGERFSYSNTGMLLLGVVIESVTGGSYFDHIRANIYDPAGMTRTPGGRPGHEVLSGPGERVGLAQ